METEKLSVSQASERLAVTIQTVRNWIKTGKLKAEKVKKGLVYEYRINETDLKIFIAENIDNL